MVACWKGDLKIMSVLIKFLSWFLSMTQVPVIFLIILILLNIITAGLLMKSYNNVTQTRIEALEFSAFRNIKEYLDEDHDLSSNDVRAISNFLWMYEQD